MKLFERHEHIAAADIVSSRLGKWLRRKFKYTESVGNWRTY